MRAEKAMRRLAVPRTAVEATRVVPRANLVSIVVYEKADCGWQPADEAQGMPENAT